MNDVYHVPLLGEKLKNFKLIWLAWGKTLTARNSIHNAVNFLNTLRQPPCQTKAKDLFKLNTSWYVHKLNEIKNVILYYSIAKIFSH